MSVRNPNHPRHSRRAVARATRRAIRTGGHDAAWLSALMLATGGVR